MKKIFLLALFFAGLAAQPLLAQEKTNDKTAELTISTSAVCHMCVNTIEKNFAFEKGVKSSKVNLENNTVTVVYRTDKTTAEEIKKALTKFGYQADEMPADEKAYEKLHECCQSEHSHGAH
jgi:copper chaperone CopZ